MMVDKGLGSN
ncbi:hypothetical protein ZEAMMB73_Zm00001d017219 [Zea mays]|uniref:Uncharacterized protein n=1 Tax=Zea mays TaxID=4577 RepID=A0A1D6HD61_MAIZE|nr:hypothetical protein ZEAMMB73_Zm00001d017219 [Zea mays]